MHFTALYPEVVLVEIDRKSPTLFFLNIAIDQSMGMALGKVYLPQMVTYTSKRHNAVKTASNILVCVGSSYLWLASSPVVYFILWSSNNNKCFFFLFLICCCAIKELQKSVKLKS